MKKEKGKRKNIAVALSSIIDSYQRSILAGIQWACQEKDVSLMIISDDEPANPEHNRQEKYSLFHHIDHHVLDGLIIMSGAMSVFIGTEGLMGELEHFHGLPMVSIGLDLPGIPSVLVDNYKAMEDLMHHLIDVHSYKNMAILTGPMANHEAVERFNAYKETLMARGLKYKQDLVVPGEFLPGDGHRAMKILLEERKKNFDVILCEDDLSALEAIDYLNLHPMENPPAVVGFDDIEISQFSNPPLTTVRQPLFEMGERAVQSLLDLLDGNQAPQVDYLEAQLNIRESCRCQGLDKGCISCEEQPEKTPHEISKELEILLQRPEFLAKEDKALESLVTLEVRGVLIALLDYLKTGREEELKSCLIDMQRRSMRRNRDASFWTGQLLPYFQALGLDPFLSTVWIKIRSYLHEGENRFRGREKLKYDQLITHFHNMIDLLVMGAKEEELRKALTRSLPLMRIPSMLIFLYEEGAQKVSLFYKYRDKEEQPIGTQRWESRRFFPEDEEYWRNKSYFVLPLHSEKTSLGYILMEATDISNEFFQDLAEKLSRGLQGLFLMEKIQSYTAQLEDEVSKRTQQLEEANLKLKELSFRDELSGLRNRRYLNEVILPEADRLRKKCLYRAKKKEKRSSMDWSGFALMMVDLDHFKWVNDTYGHEAGDRVIQQISEIFNQQCRTDDFVIRFGGEEFLIILRDFQISCLAEKAETLRRAVEDHSFVIPGEKHLHRTCSIGCISYPIALDMGDRINFNDSISLIDKALYFAKESGRNQARILTVNPEYYEQEDIRDKILFQTEELLEKGWIAFQDARDLLDKSQEDLIVDKMD